MDPRLEFPLKLVLLVGMLLGLIGLIVPVFPGITVIWVLVLLYGVITGFGRAGIWFCAAITVLAIAGWLSDNFLMGAKAREQGARWLSIAVAMVAGFIASIFFTPLGGILASLLGIFLVEYAYRKDVTEALSAMQGMALGLGWAFVARFGIGAAMIGLWAIWAY